MASSPPPPSPAMPPYGLREAYRDFCVECSNALGLLSQAEAARLQWHEANDQGHRAPAGVDRHTMSLMAELRRSAVHLRGMTRELDNAGLALDLAAGTAAAAMCSTRAITCCP